MQVTFDPSDLALRTQFMALAEAGVFVTLSIVCAARGRLPREVAYRVCSCDSDNDRDLVDNVLRGHFVSARGWEPKRRDLFVAVGNAFASRRGRHGQPATRRKPAHGGAP